MFSINCKQAAALISLRLEGELPLRERLLLGLHLCVCKLCRRFQRQLLFLRRVMRPYARHHVNEVAAPSLSDEARERIRRALESTLK